MKQGLCKLCLRTKQLQESHFLPAAVFRALLSPTERNPHPRFVSPNVTVDTSRQMKDYVLCFDCEQRFSKNGERWVLSHMARNSSFPLQESLRKAPPIRSIPTLATYAAASIPEIDVDKLEYFALSVFWRAAVHDWGPVHEQEYQRLELGPYEETLRQFLLGVVPFPAHVVMLISVYEELDITRTAFPPVRGERMPEGRSYSFLIPGIQFSMSVGKGLPPEITEFNSHGAERRIFVARHIGWQADRLRSKLMLKQLGQAGSKR